MPTIFRAAAAHLSPVVLNSRATTDKVLASISKASANSASLICFPESFIPAFPIWSALFAPTVNHDFFQRFARESIFADGDELAAIRHAARQARIGVSVGFSEKVRYSTATLFNSNVIVSSTGEVKVHHRKLVPTWFEKLSWANGDGAGLKVAEMESMLSQGGIGDETTTAKVGALICGENTNPLARYALMAQGEQIHISTWPAVWPTRLPTTLSSSDQKEEEKTKTQEPKSRIRNYDNVTANRTRAAAGSFEGKLFSILCASHLSQSNIHDLASLASDFAVSTKPSVYESTKSILESLPRAPSMFLDPTGAVHPSFTFSSTTNISTASSSEEQMLINTEDLLYADLDLDECVEGKQYHDLVGGYQRADVFGLTVDRSRRDVVTFTNDNSVDHLEEKVDLLSIDERKNG